MIQAGYRRYMHSNGEWLSSESESDDEGSDHGLDQDIEV